MSGPKLLLEVSSQALTKGTTELLKATPLITNTNMFKHEHATTSPSFPASLLSFHTCENISTRFLQ